MCELCSADAVIQKAAMKALTRTADRLEALAGRYRDLATSEIKPHSDEYADIGPTAKAVLKDLVETWV